MKVIGDYIRVNHDGSWSVWKCRNCGDIKHFVRFEEPNGECEHCKTEND